MCDLISDLNNTPKKILQGWKNRAEIDIGNTKEYDVKTYQVKTTILNFTKAQQKGLKLNRSHKEMLV